MKSQTRSNVSFIETAEGIPLTDNKKTADRLVKYFAQNSSNVNYPADFLIIKAHLKNKKYQQNLNLDPINKPFRIEELQNVLINCKDFSPGSDNIPNALIKQLPQQALVFFLDLYNTIWDQ